MGRAAPRRSTTPSPPRCAAAASRCSTWPTCSPRRSPSPRPAPSSPQRCWPTPGWATRCAGTSPTTSPTSTRPSSPRAHRRPRPRGAAQRRPGGLVYALMDRHDFVIDPLPNLLFTRDSSVWIGDRVAVTSLAMPARRRETTLTDAIYRHHPRFAGTRAALPARSGASRGRRRAAARARGARRRGRRADHAGRRRAAGPAGASPPAWRTPCWWCRSPRNGPPCTSTPSARWSTSTRCVMYPNVASTLHGVHASSPAPTASRRSTARRRSCAAAADGDGHRHAAGHRHRPRPGDRRARAVGRRQQHPRARPRGSASPTSATWRPTPSWSAPASRSSGSPAPSWARGRGGPRCMSCPRPRLPPALSAGRRAALAATRPGSARSGELAAEQALAGPALGGVQRLASSANASAYRLANAATGASHSSAATARAAGPRPAPAGRAPGTCRRTWCPRRAVSAPAADEPGQRVQRRRPRRRRSTQRTCAFSGDPAPVGGRARRPASRSGRSPRSPAPATPARSGRRPRRRRARSRSRRAS